MSIFDSSINYEMPEIIGYLVKSAKNREIDLAAEELRLILENDSDIAKYVILEKMKYQTKPSAEREIDCEQLRSEGGLLLWYRSRNQAQSAYSEIMNNALDHLPPLTITLEQASIDGLELSECLAVRCKSVFEAPTESWLKALNCKIIEQEIEQGSMIFSYYSENANVIQSATLTSAQSPRRLRELLGIMSTS